MTLSISDHVEIKCDGTCFTGRCMFCEGELFGCKVCGSHEGATTTDCPKVDMTAEQVDAVYAGTLDFRDGQWREGETSRWSPAWWRSKAGRKELAEYEAARNA